MNDYDPRFSNLILIRCLFHLIGLTVGTENIVGQPAASLGLDYTVLQNEVSITGEVTEVTVFRLLDDTLEETPEYFEVSLTSVNGIQLDNPATTIIEVLDNEGRISSISI